MILIISLIISIVFLILFNRLMGYRKGNITVDFDERYINHKEYVVAIKSKLEDQGREVYYTGNNRFIIDGENYLFYERNVSMGGVPLQRTILKLEK